jgi:hypothetical protein
MSAIPGTSGRYIGKPIRRLHDRRLVTGTGQFVGDVRIPGTLSAVFVRSPYAHARITSIDASPAMELEGVVTILTGTDLPLLMHPLVTDHEYPPHRHLERYPLTTDKARFAGDAVAVAEAEQPARLDVGEDRLVRAHPDHPRAGRVRHHRAVLGAGHGDLTEAGPALLEGDDDEAPRVRVLLRGVDRTLDQPFPPLLVIGVGVRRRRGLGDEEESDDDERRTDGRVTHHGVTRPASPG